MKTNFKSKTESNVQEAISKSMAVIISIALISISLNAQDFNYSTFEKINFNETTLAMADNSTKTSFSSTNSNALIVFTETEEALQLEDWMMDESNFSALNLLATESESPMELESWMTNESVFNSGSSYLEVENEEALVLESWMTDESNFNKSSFQLIGETEKALELENWMLNEDLFSTPQKIDQPLALENWMISENIWK